MIDSPTATFPMDFHFKITRSRTLLFVQIGFFVACLLSSGCVQSDTKEALSLAADLRALYGSWAKDGRPEQPNVNAYIHSNRRQFFIYTNVVRVETNYFHCRFGARSQNLQRKGVLAICDEQVMLWIPDESGEVIVDPQNNSRFNRKW